MKVDLKTGKPIPEGKATQLAHKAQAVKRTVAAVIAGLIVVNGVIAVFVEAFGVYLGDVHLGWIAGASAFIAAVVAFLQRLLLIESWQPFFEKIGIGTGIEDEVDGTIGSDQVEGSVNPDHLN